jgi:hypothetical protein
MGVDYSTDIYLPNYDMWARPVTFYPLMSQPTMPSFNARGVFNTVAIDIIALDASDISEQRTILDILEREFAILPTQQDQVFIGADPNGMPEVGMFEINATETNGGGETTLTLRKLMTANPP